MRSVFIDGTFRIKTHFAERHFGGGADTTIISACIIETHFILLIELVTELVTTVMLICETLMDCKI
jgi:hypothetical protein